MKIGELRRSLFVGHDCKWNGLVRDVTAELEHPDEEVSELDTYRVLLEKLITCVFLDRNYPCGETLTGLFKESV